MKNKSKIFILLKAAVVIAVALAFVMPSSAVFANKEDNSMKESLVYLSDYKFECLNPYNGQSILEEEDVPAAMPLLHLWISD